MGATESHEKAVRSVDGPAAPELAVVVNLRRDRLPEAERQTERDDASSQRSGGLHNASSVALAAKRTLDVVIAGATMLVLSPIAIVAAILVRSTSRGPLFYRSERVGKGGEVFTFLKLRSMYVDAEYERPQLEVLNEKDGPIFKMRRDPRVTPVGRVLRKLSIDELPQLLHVLSGRMSLVGPRPHLPDEVHHYGARERRRLEVKPGITCIWQVSGRADLDFETWIDTDLQYIDSWSLWLDVKLLFLTIPAVLTGRGAY